MNIVVPLAGPDFFLEGNVLKPLIEFNNDYMLRYILQNRSWFSFDHQYIFILRDHIGSHTFSENYLLNWFPNAKCIFLSHATRGAAYSVLAGLASIVNPSSPLIIDLADIYFKLPLHIDCCQLFSDFDGVAFYFTSILPIYSYFQFNNECFLVRAAEKKVISNNASVGVYVYRDLATFLFAFSRSIAFEPSLSYNSNVFVCPIFNALALNDMLVKCLPVSSVIDPKVDTY